MFSKEYLAQNVKMHATRAGWGKGGLKFIGPIVHECANLDTNEVLDYGCGKGELVYGLREIGMMAYGYDPAVPMWDTLPDACSFAMVTCTDVMEHVEEQHVDAVLGHIRKLARKGAFFSISTVPAVAHLPDGRNAHVTIREPSWWLAKLATHFRKVRYAAEHTFRDTTPVFVTDGHG